MVLVKKLNKPVVGRYTSLPKKWSIKKPGLTLPLKILILSYLYLILMATVIVIMLAALALGAYKGYNFWDSIKKKSQKVTTGYKKTVTGFQNKAQ